LTGTGAIQGSYLINDIAPDGTFKVTVPESEYKVAVGFLPSYRIESIRMGSVMSNG
jgi:hypothetical protein